MNARDDTRHLSVAVTGATGLIGGRLMGMLREGGHEGIGLRRGLGENSWNVETGEIRTGRRVDGVVHLAGRAVWSGRGWTRRVRREIWDSRVTATEKLCGYLAGMKAGERPEVLVCASGIGVYGSRGEELLTEGSAVAAAGATFLSDVCRGWEGATKAAERAGIRVVRLRIGVVLSGEGGALMKMAGPTKWGLGGPVGSGMQWMSWISVTDMGRLIVALMMAEGVGGAVNGVSGAVRQHEFIRTLGRVLRRPTVFPMPAFLVKLLFGQMGKEALLMSQRVEGRRLPAGFEFLHGGLEGAMRAEMGLG